MKSSEISIKSLLPKDNQELLKIGHETFYDAFGPPINTEENIQNYLDEKFTLTQINRELQNPNSFFYFAILDNEIVGYLKLNISNAQTERIEDNALEIERIYVIKGLQGKNIGQSLLQKSLEIAKEKNTDYIWLGVWDENTAAIRFYERNGFKIFDKHGFVLGTEAQTDLMMKLTL